MDTSSRLSAYFARYVRRWSFALVLVSGLILGYFTFRTFLSPLPRQYQLDFQNAQWIEPPEFAPVAYFRKDVFLSVAPEQAWLEIAATDNFQLFVNGRDVGGESSLKTRVAEIYDIKGGLRPGTNVIAVQISRATYPGSAQLLVCGLFREPGGKTTSLLSDEHWRVAPKTGIVAGSEGWTSSLVEEEVWPNARRAIIRERPIHIDWVYTNPLLLQGAPSGSWIMADTVAREAVFSTSLNAAKTRQETWIQIASTGNLDLLVNGKLITTVTTKSTREKLPRLPSATDDEAPTKIEDDAATTSKPISSSEAPDLKAYDISYWIRKGPNTIVAAVRSDYGPASLLANGFMVEPNGSLQRFQTDAQWQIGEQWSHHRIAKSHPAVELGSNGSAPWGYLPQGMVKRRDIFDPIAVARAWGAILAVIIATVAVWLVVSHFVARVRGEPLQYALSRDALFHAPIAVTLVFLLLPGYDPRFPQAWPFQPKFFVGAMVAFIVVRLLHFFVRRHSVPEHFKARISRLRDIAFGEALPYLLLAAIMGLGLALRYHDLGSMSFDHDEMGQVQKSKGVLKLGFPYNELAGRVRPSSTYELIPYPMAVSGFIFGYSEWSMRLPACVMGTLCILIIALMGRQLFNWRTGLIAALVYACIPLNIRWAQNAFYLQQTQFFALLTFSRFYEAIKVRPLQRNYLTAAAVACCATYLSWEGSVFILPALLIALLVVRWGEWWWLKEIHLYRCLFLIGAVITTQYCLRTMASSPYLQVGSGLSNITGPSLFFLDPGYQPLYYVNKLFFVENHVFFTVILLLGLPFCWRQRGFRYVVALLGALFLCHTNFLAALSPRYCYYYQPLLVLGGIGAAVTLYDRLIFLARREGNSLIARTVAHGTAVAAIALLFLQSNEWLIKDYSLASEGDSPGFMTRMNIYKYDYRGAAQYVKSQFQPGDQIVPTIPHVFEYYSGIAGDYYLNTLLSKKVTYNEKFPEPRFIDKFRGYPTIRSLTELLEVTHRARRTWIIFAPLGGYQSKGSPEVREYLEKHAKVVFESYRAKVVLVEGASEPEPTSVAKSTGGL
jgi:dolichyl-phosphate-mannose-protein mannosyltransferase